jgi:hypothetical protein
MNIKLYSVKFKGEKNAGDPDVDWRIIGEMFLKKYAVRMWIGFRWLLSRPKATSCESGNEYVDSVKCGNFLDLQLLSSQAGLRSTHLNVYLLYTSTKLYGVTWRRSIIWFSIF